MQQYNPICWPQHHLSAVIVISISLFVSIVACVAGAAHQRPASTADTTQPHVPAPNSLVGIDFPRSAVLDHMPPVIRDYIRTAWPGLLPVPSATNPELGISMPARATRSDLPPGVTDYVRDQTPGPTH
jgi:hypothetical protein